MVSRRRKPAAALLAAALVAGGPLACVAPRGGPAPSADPAVAKHPGSTTTVLVVRHAEKNSDGRPANLAAADGLPRAEALAAIATREGVAAIYSTEFCRTVQTAQPAARELGLPIHLLRATQLGDDLSRCAPSIETPTVEVEGAFEPRAQAARILASHAGETVLVVGHSNTVPALVEALGAGPLCPALVPWTASAECEISEGRYGDLFVVRVAPSGSAKVEGTRYGEGGVG